MIANWCGLHTFCEREKEQVPVGGLEETRVSNQRYEQPVCPRNNTKQGNGALNMEVLTHYMAANFPLCRQHV